MRVAKSQPCRGFVRKYFKVIEEYSPLPPPFDQDQLLRRLSLLYELSQAMMTTIKLGDLLEIIMTAVTMGSGLGFNRAMLFLTDTGKERLAGVIGVAPENTDEASRIWDEFSQKKVGLLEWVQSTERKRSLVKSTFDDICRSLVVPLSSEGGLLARTILEKMYFNIRDDIRVEIDAAELGHD